MDVDDCVLRVEECPYWFEGWVTKWRFAAHGTCAVPVDRRISECLDPFDFLKAAVWVVCRESCKMTEAGRVFLDNGVGEVVCSAEFVGALGEVAEEGHGDSRVVVVLDDCFGVPCYLVGGCDKEVDASEEID